MTPHEHEAGTGNERELQRKLTQDDKISHFCDSFGIKMLQILERQGLHFLYISGSGTQEKQTCIPLPDGTHEDIIARVQELFNENQSDPMRWMHKHAPDAQDLTDTEALTTDEKIVAGIATEYAGGSHLAYRTVTIPDDLEHDCNSTSTMERYDAFYKRMKWKTSLENSLEIAGKILAFWRRTGTLQYILECDDEDASDITDPSSLPVITAKQRLLDAMRDIEPAIRMIDASARRGKELTNRDGDEEEVVDEDEEEDKRPQILKTDKNGCLLSSVLEIISLQERLKAHAARYGALDVFLEHVPLEDDEEDEGWREADESITWNARWFQRPEVGHGAILPDDQALRMKLGDELESYLDPDVSKVIMFSTGDEDDFQNMSTVDIDWSPDTGTFDEDTINTLCVRISHIASTHKRSLIYLSVEGQMSQNGRPTVEVRILVNES